MSVMLLAVTPKFLSRKPPMRYVVDLRRDTFSIGQKE